MEIISDAIHYPLNHVKELAIYIALTFVMLLILIFAGVGLIAGSDLNNLAAAGLIGIIGFILALIVSLLIEGYGLDILKLGIERSQDAPSIDIARQVINGIKYLIVAIVYLIIPCIIMVILMQINKTLGLIIGLIIFIIFGLGLYMGSCRLAKTESLGYALNIPEAFQDIMKVGIVKLLVVLILVGIIAAILNWIAGLFGGMGTIGAIISSILQAIVGAYLFFFNNRAVGLLYSDIE